MRYRVVKRINKYEITSYTVQQCFIDEHSIIWQDVKSFNFPGEAETFMTKLSQKKITEKGEEIIAWAE